MSVSVFGASNLFGLTLSNRFVASPMCQYAADASGKFADWHIFHYLNLASTGVSTVIVESCAISETGKITENDLSLYNKEHLDSHSDFVRSFKKHFHNVALGIQISHAGRKSRSAKTLYSSAPIPLTSDSATPKELSASEIDAIFGDFARAVDLAIKAGYDFCEIHMAHGYLVHQFLSPYVNKRADAYGDPYQFLSKLIERIYCDTRCVSRRFNLGARITGSDWLDGGIKISDARMLAKQLEAYGFAYVDVSSGGIIPVTHRPAGPYFQAHLAVDIKSHIQIPVRCAGEMWDLTRNAELVASGGLDFIGLGRLLVRNPAILRTWAHQMNHVVPAPKVYERAFS